VARAVQLAGQALGRSGWTAAALEAVHAFLRRADAPLGVEDAGLCHGLSGLLRLLDRIGADSGDRTVLAAADELAARVVASYDPPAPFGFRAVLHTSERADLAGFLTGASGIALALHAHDRGGPPATVWDAALLIA
jgi:hypothetical protein